MRSLFILVIIIGYVGSFLAGWHQSRAIIYRMMNESLMRFRQTENPLTLVDFVEKTDATFLSPLKFWRADR